MNKKEKIKEEVVRTLQNGFLSKELLCDVVRKIKKERLYLDGDICALLLHHKSSEVDCLLGEIEIISHIEEYFSKRRSAINAAFSSSNDELFHTLLAFEQLQRQFRGIPNFGGFDVQLETNFLDGENYTSPLDAVASLEHFLSLFSVVLTYLLTDGDKSLNITFSVEKMRIACEHVPLASEWQMFFERRSFWERGCASLLITDGEIIFESSDDALVSAFRVSLTRLRAFRQSRYEDRLNNNGIVGTNAKLPLHEFRSIEEQKSCYLTSLQFYSRDLSETVFGATLSEWIRAYTALKDEAIRFISSKREVQCPKDMLFWGTRKFFIELFMNAQVSRDASETILKHFTLRKSARDILDTPLIPNGDDFVFVPSVTAMIEPAFSLESLLKNIKNAPNHDLSVIGPGLEKSLKTDLRNAGLIAEKVEYKKGKFECDVAFVLDTVLFLCECKGKYQASDFQAYADLEDYLLGDALIQHRRICEFFEANFQYVRNRLQLPPDWKPKRIVRLIVTSAKLGRPLQKDGFLILDENMFHAYFSRRSPRTIGSEGKVLQVLHEDRLSGPINAEGLIEYVMHPSTISLFNKLKARREVRLEFDSLMVSFRDVECYGESIAVKDMPGGPSLIYPFKTNGIHSFRELFGE